MQNAARRNKWYDNVAAVVLTTEDISTLLDPEQEVINAVNQKYDTLKDKLILEVGFFDVHVYFRENC